MAFYTKAFIHHSHKDRLKVERMALITERLEKIKKQESSISKELEEYLESETNKAISKLSTYLKSFDVADQFTLWTSDDVSNSDDRWELMVSNYIQTALMNRLKEVITAWEDEHHVFADVRTSLIQYLQRRLNIVEGQLRNLESSLLAEDAASSESGLQLVGKKLHLVVERMIVTLIYYNPNFAAKMFSATYGVAVLGTKVAKKKLEYWLKTKEFRKDKCTFMAKVSKEYLAEVAEEQNLRPFMAEQLKECHLYLKQVVTCIPELINADKMLFQLLRDEERPPQEIEHLYRPLCQGSLLLRERMAFFCTKEVRTMDISCSDLEWNDDKSSLLGKGSFGSVFRGKLKQRGEEQSVALKVWESESDASVFLAETETLR